MSVVVNGTNGLTFADGTTQATGFAPGMRNRIINGDMRIDQRNAGASASIATTTPTYVLDRWQFAGKASTGTYSVQRSSTAPSGFVNSSLVTVTASDTGGTAGDLYRIQYQIEGLNVSDLGWGTASAASVTLSFWVRSSVTGTFAGGIENGNTDRSYVFTFTINSANTWEQKTVTIAGDTSGTWSTDTSSGLMIRLSLGTGSTYATTAGSWTAGNYWTTTGATKLIATNGATFYITGVQIEKGSVATPFEYRQYGQELSLCQRYYYQQTYDINNPPVCSSAYWGTSTSVEWLIIYPQIMRSTPSVSIPTIGSLYALEIGVSWRQLSSYGVYESGPSICKLGGSAATNTSYTKGQGCVVGLRSAGSISYSSEL